MIDRKPMQTDVERATVLMSLPKQAVKTGGCPGCGSAFTTRAEWQGHRKQFGRRCGAAREVLDAGVQEGTGIDSPAGGGVPNQSGSDIGVSLPESEPEGQAQEPAVEAG